LPAVLEAIKRLRDFEAEVTAVFPAHDPEAHEPQPRRPKAKLPEAPGDSVPGAADSPTSSRDEGQAPCAPRLDPAE
jgi:glyoxylase-like metal-dependent hydrolase (beta-lactamase superfamily II)